MTNSDHQNPSSGQSDNGSGSLIPSINIVDEMRDSFLDYSMSVIIGRALPDIRDGLKPVHRRILYAMYKEGLLSNKKFSKSAGVVGEVLKKYHPHGDSPVYEAMVRLAQDWNMREILVKGQGNFGSIDGDPAAAYRYTEAKLTKLAEELLRDIEKGTVDFIPNFDGSVLEPTVLPTRVPNLLVNGSEGIAVAMATKCPPHNLGEIVDGLLAIIDERYNGGEEVSNNKLFELIPGPDFPTGGEICGKMGSFDVLSKGRGIVKLRGVANVVDDPSGKRQQIIITEVPFQVNKTRLLERIAELVRDKRIEGISDLRDESDRDGMRIAIDLKRDAVAEVVQNQLYQHTPLQTTYAANLLSIVDGQPKVLNLRQALDNFIDFRREIVTKRCRFELKESQSRFHIVAGLITALDDIDKVISIIRSSKNVNEAKINLCEQSFVNVLKLDLFTKMSTQQIAKWNEQGFAKLDTIQAGAILEMKMSRLVALERDKLIGEANALLDEISRLNNILHNLPVMMQVIKDELIEVKEKFAGSRKTKIIDDVEDLTIEDLIVDEEMVVTVSHQGYIKRWPLSNYQAQKRGGKGKSAAKGKSEDFTSDAFVASTHSYLLIFTNLGKVYWLKVHKIPEVSPQARGRAIVNLIELQEGEKVKAILPVKSFPSEKDQQFVVTCSKNGKIKKTDLQAYSRPRNSGLIACGIEENDELIAVKITNGKSDLLLSSKDGMAIRFDESQARPLGRSAMGVRGISLRLSDQVVGMEVINDDASILTVTELGYGKRTNISEYRRQSRGGVGVITIKADARNGRVADAIQVSGGEDVMIITDSGNIIRMAVKDVSIIGRNTKGVRLISLDKSKKERVVSVVTLAQQDVE